jgi:hypothetical protein
LAFMKFKSAIETIIDKKNQIILKWLRWGILI